MSRMLAIVGLMCASLASGASTVSAQPVNPVVRWNQLLLTIVRTPNAQPATIHPTRSFAIMHAAMFDAVTAIDRRHPPYAIRLTDVSRPASATVAAAAAAHAVLVKLYPAMQATLDTALAESIAGIPAWAGGREGLRVGETVAARLLELRSDDGADAPPLPYTFGTRPGDYQTTPPNLPPTPQFTHWPRVRPFVLSNAAQFRPGPPPSLTSVEYGRAVNEIQSLGIAEGSTATADQALSGRFWAGPIQNYWNEIAQTAATARHLSTSESARLFAYLNLTIADAAIAFYDGKYAYNLWRPVTAIRAAATDGNAETTADPNWLPAGGRTPSDPSYPGAHAVVAAAAADVLKAFFNIDRFRLVVTSETVAGVERTYESFSAAAEDASLSRVYAGVHFGFDETSGDALGREVARFVLDQLAARQR